MGPAGMWTGWGRGTQESAWFVAGRPLLADWLRRVRRCGLRTGQADRFWRTGWDGYAGAGFPLVREAVSRGRVRTGTQNSASLRPRRPSPADASQRVRADRLRASHLTQAGFARAIRPDTFMSVAAHIFASKQFSSLTCLKVKEPSQGDAKDEN